MRNKTARLRDRAIAFTLSAVLMISSVSWSALTVPSAKVQAAGTENVSVESLLIASFDEDAEGWIGYSGYNYSGGKEDPTLQGTTPAEAARLSYDSVNKRLQLHLDYSKDAKYGWSEAKIGKTFETPVSLSGYNRLTFHMVYPEGCPVVPSVFATGGESGSTVVITAQGSITEAKSNGDGTCSATVVVDFEAGKVPMKTMVLSMVGSNTDFAGTVSIDNLTLCSGTKEGEVTITEQVKQTGDTADISNMPARVELADQEAISSTAALASYLKSLQAANQSLFGHQNGISQKVRVAADGGSDVKDVTGSYSGMMGIDSLSLTGAEMGAASAEEALKKSIEVSKSAAEKGIIISLSTHMPNFTNSRVIKTEDGYDFFGCDITESKDLSGDVVNQILPGGAYREAYHAYLDIIAEYALALQEDHIPVLFRPLHEDNGNWFWWGTAISSATYKELYQDMATYLRDKGVHNLLYVYSPNGPFEGEEEYLERYPGDDYIDIVAMDYYDDHCDYTGNLKGTFMERLATSCEVINKVAKAHGKIPAIAETGVRVQREDGSMEGLLLSNNPVKGQSWYENVLETAVKNDMPYFLLWANFSTKNFYIPFKYSDTTGHELIDEFIQFYNNKASIFANGTKFYGANGAVSKKVIVAGSKEDVPQATKVPQATVKPQATKAPQTSVKPQTTVKPQATKAPASIKISASKTSIVAGKTTKLKISGLSKANAKKVVYKTSNKKVATVTSAGVVKGKKAGKVTIKAYYKNKLVGSVKITVKKAVPAKKVEFTKKKVTLKKGKTYQLRIKTSPVKTTDTITYSTSSSKVATVSKDGVVKAKKPGKAVITAKTSSGKKAAITITCSK